MGLYLNCLALPNLNYPRKHAWIGTDGILEVILLLPSMGTISAHTKVPTAAGNAHKYRDATANPATPILRMAKESSTSVNEGT